MENPWFVYLWVPIDPFLSTTPRRSSTVTDSQWLFVEGWDWTHTIFSKSLPYRVNCAFVLVKWHRNNHKYLYNLKWRSLSSSITFQKNKTTKKRACLINTFIDQGILIIIEFAILIWKLISKSKKERNISFQNNKLWWIAALVYKKLEKPTT